MNRYDQHNSRENNSGRDHENRNNRRNEPGDHNLSNHLNSYQKGGNYYGMPNNDQAHHNVRVTQGENFGNNSSGSSQRFNSNNDAYSRGNSNNSSSNSNRSEYRQNENYNAGSNQNDHYRYGDQNSHMDYNRNGGYERSRGTGWRSESDDSRRGSSDYTRQNNSYQYKPDSSGKRYSDFGRDEGFNYGHNEELTDIHTDRGEHTRHRSDNNFGNQETRNNKQNENNYATGMYSSNRAYLSDQEQNKNKNMFDHTSDDYPDHSPRGYGQKSGPDWSADSPISRGQHRGADRG